LITQLVVIALILSKLGLFFLDERPDFIDLEMLTMHAAEVMLHELLAVIADVTEEQHNRVAVGVRHTFG
jgi:hypothetical protein